ncbi:hypothetical protein HOC35_05955 [Candidatus Woesearchaeota archaeon]|jgi:hypothetical protein|nr:hypothetical protein [Candidatus Woesearchaeota archaeon]
MRKLIYFFVFFICSILVLLVSINVVLATSIGVSPAKIFLENESVNKSITIININNKTLNFELKSNEALLSFIPSHGKLKKNTNSKITVIINPNIDIQQGNYDELIIVSVFNKGNLKNSVGIKAMVNITKNISSVDYYFVNGGLEDNYNNNSLSNQEDNTNDTKVGNLITGMGIFYNGKIKGNDFVNLGIIALLIVLLYLFIREKKKD